MISEKNTQINILIHKMNKILLINRLTGQTKDFLSS